MRHNQYACERHMSSQESVRKDRHEKVFLTSIVVMPVAKEVSRRGSGGARGTECPDGQGQQKGQE